MLISNRSMRVPFVNEEHARLAKRALEVDREQNAEFVDRRLDVEGDELVMLVQFSTFGCCLGGDQELIALEITQLLLSDYYDYRPIHSSLPLI